MTTVRKCLETPAIGSTVSEQAGPGKKWNSLENNWVTFSNKNMAMVKSYILTFFQSHIF